MAQINTGPVAAVKSTALPVVGQSSRQVPLVLPPAVILNGQVVTPGEAPAAQAGNQFYVLACSAPVSIQPVRGGGTGAINSFQNGQGEKVPNGFDTLRVLNYSPVPVVCLIWIGFTDFINDQLVLAQTTVLNVAFPTYATADSGTQVNITDLSGTVITDINGQEWGAIVRVAILVFNADSGVTLLLQKAGSVVANGPAVGIIYPLTPVRFDFSGNYCLSVGGGPVNAIVSEIYQCIEF
jgi:hypothetical protein